MQKYTNDELVINTKEAINFSDLCHKLGIRARSGNYKTLKSKLDNLSVDYSHFVLWKNRGNIKNLKHTLTPLNTILVENNYYNIDRLKKRLISEGIKNSQCEMCKNTHWLQEIIPLELHHINGINTDNRLENLQLLCSNCHSITHKLNSKNKKIKNIYIEKVLIIPKELKKCVICDNNINIKNKIVCSQNCYTIFRSKNIPSKEYLTEIIKNLKSNVAVGKFFSVSNNSIKKWKIRYNL